MVAGDGRGAGLGVEGWSVGAPWVEGGGFDGQACYGDVGEARWGHDGHRLSRNLCAVGDDVQLRLLRMVSGMSIRYEVPKLSNWYSGS